MQKKLMLICGVVIAIGTASGVLFSGLSCIESRADSYVCSKARSVACGLDSGMAARRFPVDSLMLHELRSIRREQRKAAFYQEHSITPAAVARINAAWRSDSIFNAKYPDR